MGPYAVLMKLMRSHVMFVRSHAGPHEIFVRFLHQGPQLLEAVSVFAEAIQIAQEIHESKCNNLLRHTISLKLKKGYFRRSRDPTPKSVNN